MWEHLLDDSVDERFKIASKIIGKDVIGKHIVDVNCGIGRFENFIEGYSSYYGNDISNEYISKTPKKDKCVFEVLDEEDLLERLTDKPVDILVLFGAGLGGVEGKSTTSVMRDIAKEKIPEYIVIEMVIEYEKDYSLMTTYKEIFEKLGYEIVKETSYIGNDNGKYEQQVIHRCICIFKKYE